MDSNGGSGGEILSIGDAVSFRLDDNRAGFGTEGCFHLNNNDTSFSNVPSNVKVDGTGWRYVVLTFDNASLIQALYIDGICYGRIPGVGAINYSGVGINTLIGKHGNGKNNFNFMGRIDEARINTTALSVDWIELCYKNQGQQDALITYIP
jgi:hypothetical protein